MSSHKCLFIYSKCVQNRIPWLNLYVCACVGGLQNAMETFQNSSYKPRYHLPQILHVRTKSHCLWIIRAHFKHLPRIYCRNITLPAGFKYLNRLSTFFDIWVRKHHLCQTGRVPVTAEMEKNFVICLALYLVFWAGLSGVTH